MAREYDPLLAELEVQLAQMVGEYDHLLAELEVQLAGFFWVHNLCSDLDLEGLVSRVYTFLKTVGFGQ